MQYLIMSLSLYEKLGLENGHRWLRTSDDDVNVTSLSPVLLQLFHR